MNDLTGPDGVAWLRGLLSAEVVAEFHRSISSVTWQNRRNARGSVEALPPATHGAVTGRVCDYFSHPELLAEVNRITGITAQHFLGTVIRVRPGAKLKFQHSQFPLAMVVNLSPDPLQGWQVGPGDASILDQRHNSQFHWPAQSAVRCLIDGYFV